MPEEVARATDLLGRRWVLAIVYASHGGATRFNEFKRSVVGIGPRALAQRLQDLEDAGILERRVLRQRARRASNIGSPTRAAGCVRSSAHSTTARATSAAHEATTEPE